MKKAFMLIAAMCMTSVMAFAQKTIRVSTDKTDLVMQVSPKGRLYQVYLGDKLKNPADYQNLKWDVYAASDGAVCQRGHEVYATSGAEDFFEPAVAVTHADGNMTTYLYYKSSEEKAINGGTETIITLQDKVYPLTVKLHYAAYPKENVIKAWSEISHKEKAPVTLWRYSSTMLYFKANKYFVTNYHSDWAKEGQPETCQLTTGKKIVDTNKDYSGLVGSIVSFKDSKDGVKLTDKSEGKEWTGKSVLFKKGKPTVTVGSDDFKTDAKTVFVYATDDGKDVSYKSYTGYKNAPSIGANGVAAATTAVAAYLKDRSSEP